MATFDAVGTVIKGAAGLITLVPGIALLAKAVTVPPPAETIISVVTLVEGMAVVLAVVLMQDVIRRIPSAAMGGGVLIVAFLGAWMASYYAQFADKHVVEFDNMRIVRPDRPSAELSAIMQRFNYDYGEALTDSADKAKVALLIDNENGPTQTLMIFYLLLAQTLLLGGIVAGAWKIAQTLERDAPAEPKPTLPAAP